jgi:hypothetical protein
MNNNVRRGQPNRGACPKRYRAKRTLRRTNTPTEVQASAQVRNSRAVTTSLVQ